MVFTDLSNLKIIASYHLKNIAILADIKPTERYFLIRKRIRKNKRTNLLGINKYLDRLNTHL